MTIKHTALYFSILLASFSLQAAYNPYGYGPTPPPTFVDPRDRVDSPPAYGPPSYEASMQIPSNVPSQAVSPTTEYTFLDTICAAFSYIKDNIQYRLEDYTPAQIAIGSVAAVAATYGLYKTGAALCASRAAIKYTALVLYHISRLTGSAAGYCLSSAGSVVQRFPTICGASICAAGTCGVVRHCFAVHGE